MKKALYTLFFFGVIGIVFTGCNDEADAGAGATDTFIKLFGSENQETANDIVVESSGNLLLLSTQEIEDDNQSISRKIKVRYVDDLGNLLWENSYPEGDFDDTELQYLASSVIPHPSGYLIAGQSINSNDQKSLLILNIDPSGEEINTMQFFVDEDSTDVAGVGIGINSNDEIKVSAQVESDGNEFWVGTFSNNLENLEDCSFFYAAASSSPTMRKSTHINANDEIVFGISGTQEGDRINSRLAKVPSCQPAPLSSPFISTSGSSNFNASFISPTLFGFALVGTTDASDNEDIFLARVDNDGALLDEAPIIFDSESTGVDFTREEEGLSVVQASDGGLLIGGSSESNEDGGSDIVLIKTDFNGNVQWIQFYGDRNDEEANIVAQAPGNGFIVLGTTEFGGINSLILIKIDRLGNVN